MKADLPAQVTKAHLYQCPSYCLFIFKHSHGHTSQIKQLCNAFKRVVRILYRCPSVVLPALPYVPKGAVKVWELRKKFVGMIIDLIRNTCGCTAHHLQPANQQVVFGEDLRLSNEGKKAEEVFHLLV